LPAPTDTDRHADPVLGHRITRHVTITWQVGRGGWLSRIVFGVLTAVILIVAALVSIVVLAWLVLGILALLAIVLWKTRVTGQGASWTILRGKRPRR